jgi:hypothetical protein
MSKAKQASKHASRNDPCINMMLNALLHDECPEIKSTGEFIILKSCFQHEQS